VFIFQSKGTIPAVQASKESDPAGCGTSRHTLREAKWSMDDDRSGVSFAEYLLLVVLIVAAALAGMTFLGPTTR
jgi:hypothetical protein